MKHKDAYLKSLELDKAGEWDGAHEMVQDIEAILSYRIHAYLHRVEGDLGNAGYWYRRAKVPPCETDLKTEWQALHDEIAGT